MRKLFEVIVTKGSSDNRSDKGKNPHMFHCLHKLYIMRNVFHNSPHNLTLNNFPPSIFRPINYSFIVGTNNTFLEGRVQHKTKSIAPCFFVNLRA